MPWCMRALVAGAVQMLEQGFSADSADYDGRTALMLCAGKGHTGAQTPDVQCLVHLVYLTQCLLDGPHPTWCS